MTHEQGLAIAADELRAGYCVLLISQEDFIAASQAAPDDVQRELLQRAQQLRPPNFGPSTPIKVIVYSGRPAKDFGAECDRFKLIRESIKRSAPEGQSEGE